jgi:phosphate transport system substrate-binding protein
MGMVRASALACGLWAAALPALAGPVTLTSYDGSVSLRGELLGFDGETFRIATAIGELAIDAMQVTCEGPDCPPPELLRSVFRVSGSSTLGALMPALIEAYALSLDAALVTAPVGPSETRFDLTRSGDRPLAEITVAAPGTAVAFNELAARISSIAMASRRVREAEAGAIREAGLGDVFAPGSEHVVALDGLLALVAPSNPLRAISLADLASLFAGRIANWSELGGPDLPVTLYGTGQGHATREVFETLVMRPANLALADTLRVLSTHEDVSDAVAADPGGIGFAGLPFLRNAKALAIRTECGTLASPDAFSIKTEEYPLARRLYLYTPEGPMPPQARRLVEFALSDAAQPVIAEAGYIDQSIASLPLDRQGLRVAGSLVAAGGEVGLTEVQAMMAALLRAERLSTTFRFLPGTSALDARSVVEARRLAELLAAGAFAGREILLAGFTDSVGRADLNRALSERRAEQARQAILAAAPPGTLDAVPITVVGYGEMSPVGCNETFEGRRINRRVEVWVRDPA